MSCLQCLSPLGCYNQVPYTEWHISHRNVFLTVLEVLKSQMEGPADSGSGGVPSLGHSSLFAVSSRGGRSPGSLRRPQSPHKSPPVALPLIPPHWGLGFSV